MGSIADREWEREVIEAGVNVRSTVIVTGFDRNTVAELGTPAALAGSLFEPQGLSCQFDSPVLFGCADDAEPRLFRGVFFGLILSTISWAGVAFAIFC